MSTYILHLGFRWDSSPIGAVLTTGNLGDYRPLQFALGSDSGTPAWFRFQNTDSLSVTVWDLSSEAASTGGARADVALGFASLSGANGPQALSPVDLVTAGSSWTLKPDAQSHTQLLCSTAQPSNLALDTCPWAGARASYDAGVMRLVEVASFEMSFLLEVTRRDGASQVFVADPEVIVGAGGTAPT
ncbi:hypothetical protein [Haliangium ochraceum]|uniref:Uncharacterized protein n=1 Tax=Haliangium ochraceum (strain DSM 14365 / JCM 11303 / SMP-2) TaxID=502025 RepID=D0LFY6_HALO1|nr:hypothetical protein [Haliangium ochraceum]ACY14588.1 hypothetical protein Hoch_2043 [Haliangium ochraceum DSM 14365]